MRMDTLVRVGGWAAILTGVLRAADSFVSIRRITRPWGARVRLLF